MTASARSGRLGVGIVGAGRVGPVLGAALGGAGHAVVGISAVSQEARDRADAMLPGVPVLDVPTIVERSELVVLAVPAEQLEALVAGLAATGAWQAGQLVAHTAPGFGTAVLDPARAAGAIPLATSPAMAFTDEHGPGAGSGSRGACDGARPGAADRAGSGRDGARSPS
ncbi:MAG: NAD(P)-binding domain-containing protein [Schumannella sp.]